MLNLFKKPFEKSSLEAWAKMSDDIAKVAILAVPVILYGNETFSIKLLNIVLVAFGAYCSLIIGRIIRQYLLKQEENQ